MIGSDSGTAGSRIVVADLALGVLALAASVLYLYETSQIAESLLEDSVGARGVPLAIGWMMAALGAVLCVRGLLVRRSDERPPAPGREPFAASLRPHLQALGLLAILAAYVALLPYAGYIASTAFLIAAAAWSCGAMRSWRVPATAVAGSVFLWCMFDPILRIALPAGSWWGGR